MNASLPSALLLRLIHAPPEKLAAVERVLDGEAFPDCQQRPPLANETTQAPPHQSIGPDQETLSIAAKVFELLTALDPDSRFRKAQPIKVFLLHFRQNFSRSQIARVCGCSRTLVAERLRRIREKLPWQPHQLRELSGHVEAMEDAVSDSRARRIYRKGAVCGVGEEG
jgi:hypothetical protein